MAARKAKTDLDVVVEVHNAQAGMVEDPDWDLAEYIGVEPETLRVFTMSSVEAFHKAQPLVVLTDQQLASLFLSGWLMGTGYERRRMDKHW